MSTPIVPNSVTIGTSTLLSSVSTNTGALVVQGGVGISGNTTIGGNVSILGNTTLAGNLMVSGNTYIYGNTYLYGNTILAGNLWVAGTIFMNNGLVGTFGGGGGSLLNVGGYSYVQGNLFVGGNLVVSGNAYFNGVVNPLTLADGSVLFTNNQPLDLSNNLGIIWTPSTSAPSLQSWDGIAMSNDFGTGQAGVPSRKVDR